jgi:hypothetical protein
MEHGGYNYKECKELERELEIDGAFWNNPLIWWTNLMQ